MTTLSGRAIWEGEWAKPGVEGLAWFQILGAFDAPEPYRRQLREGDVRRSHPQFPVPS